MIPLTAIPWRLIGYGAAVAAVALMGWRVSVWHGSHKALRVAEKALKAERQCADGTECAKRVTELNQKAVAATAEARATYEQELASVRSNRPVRVVRLCPDPGDVRDAGTAPGTYGTPAPGGVVSGPAGRDLGPNLYALAREADELAAQLRALQQFNRALATERGRVSTK